MLQLHPIRYLLPLLLLPHGGCLDKPPRPYACPPDAVCPTFAVDDRANKVFDNEAELEWKGAFKLTERDGRLIVPDGNWSGPFPRLCDNGPLPFGCERPDGVAEDHFWTTLVEFPLTAFGDQEEVTLQYGAQWGGGYWIWIGNNGQLKLRRSQAGTLVMATALIVPKHGAVDLKLILDTANLCAPSDLGEWDLSRVQVKVSQNCWLLAPCSDDGKQGDATANDGRWTCVLSLIKSKYNGLLSCSSQASFVFTLGQANTEYKAEGQPCLEGVTAFLGASGIDWSPVRVERDSGADANTMVRTHSCGR